MNQESAKCIYLGRCEKKQNDFEYVSFILRVGSTQGFLKPFALCEHGVAIYLGW